MAFDWSAQSPQIQTLFRPWQAGDGYPETDLAAAEAPLGFRLPATLRHYYAAWGLRNDMNQIHDNLLEPDRLFVLSDVLVFSAENQAAYYWGIPLAMLAEPDPPVSMAGVNWRLADNAPTIDGWDPSHPHLSVFLDELTYKHALHGGAVHGGVSREMLFEATTVAQLEQYWQKVTVTPMFYALMPDVDFEVPFLYVRDSKAAFWWGEYYVAAGSTEDLETIAAEFHITWDKQW